MVETEFEVEEGEESYEVEMAQQNDWLCIRHQYFDKR